MKMKIKKFLSSITVEPITFLAMIGYSVHTPLFQDTLRQKICHKIYNYTLELCTNQTALINNIENTSDLTTLDNIFATTANWIMFNALIMTVPAIFLAPFMGAWSDVFGRKIPILINIFGRLSTSILLLLNIIYMDWPAYIMLLVNLPYMFTGAQTILLMLLYSSIADITEKENRTTRLSILQACYYMGSTLGNLIGGQLASKVNYETAIAVIVGIHTLNLIYILIRIPNSSYKKSDCESEKKESNEKLCSIKHVTDTISTACRKRPNHARIYILLLIFVHCLVSGINSGENEITLLYVETPPLSWNVEFYTIYSAYGTLIVGLSMLLLLPFIQKKFKLRDTTLIILGFLSKSIFVLMVIFAKKSWMIFTGVTFGIMCTYIDVGAKSGFSKLVNDDEQGKVFSFASLLDSITPIIFNIIYNEVYQLTILENHSGYTYFLTVASLLLIVSIACGIHFTFNSDSYQEYLPLIDGNKNVKPRKISAAIEHRIRKISRDYIRYTRDIYNPRILF